MQRVLSAAEMRAVDHATIEQRQVPGIVLMETAARAVTDSLLARTSNLQAERVLVLCGKGNNGGDGLAAARQLLLRAPRLRLRTALLADPGSLMPDAAANWAMLAAQDHVADIVPTESAWEAFLPAVADSTIVVDALLGTGISGAPRGLVAKVIADVNSGLRGARVVAVDMPSGLGSDAGAIRGDCMRADWTVTFTAPKVGQVLAPACERVGELIVARIGTADSVIQELPGPRLLLAEKSDARRFAARRDRSGHKGTYGHVLAVGGSRSKPGAILMTGKAALRAGAGLSTVATASGAAEALLATAPELMLEPAGELPDGTLGPEQFNRAWFAGKSVVAVGPGLGTSTASAALVQRIAAACPLPLVVDADGLAAVTADLLRERAAPTVLTPHPGEMGRMIGTDAASVQRDRVRAARDFAAASGAYVVLKGNRTLTAAPDGEVIVNPTGTPGMATAGSGDVLTGMIAAFLAQFPGRPVRDTVAAAVYLHGAAGELAAAEQSEQCMLATDISQHLPEAIKEAAA